MKVIVALSVLGALAACATTRTTTTSLAVKHRPSELVTSANNTEPSPPAEGPQDVPPGPAQDPNRNPALVPSPLLRYSAASMTP